MSLYDIVGLIGATAYVAAYFAVQVLHRAPTGRLSFTLNLVGPVCLLVSLSHAFNLGSALAQLFWLVLTLVGRWRRRAPT